MSRLSFSPFLNRRIVRVVLVGFSLQAIATAQEETVDVRLFFQATDLDLDGTMVYAVNFGSASTRTLAGQTFLPDSTLEELELSAEEPISEWGERNAFGADQGDDQILSELMHSMRWAAHPSELTFQFPGLDARSSHKLQLLFAEKCCDRGFDIVINGEVLVPQFSPKQLGADTPEAGVVVSIILEPGVSVHSVALRGAPARFPDPSPVIQVATLERLSASNPSVSEPATVSLTRSASQIVTLRWPGEPGLSYEIEYSEGLVPNTWLALGDPIIGNGNAITWRDENVARISKPAGHYRLRQSRSNQ